MLCSSIVCLNSGLVTNFMLKSNEFFKRSKPFNRNENLGLVFGHLRFLRFRTWMKLTNSILRKMDTHKFKPFEWMFFSLPSWHFEVVHGLFSIQGARQPRWVGPANCLVQIRGIWFVGIQESSKQYTPVANGDMHRMGSVFLCLFFFGRRLGCLG